MSIFAGAGRLEPNAPVVVSETAEGETIILHHGSGTYFSTSGTGLAIWEAVERAASADEIVSAFTERYSIAPGLAQAAVHAFLQKLVEHDLVRTAQAGQPPAPGQTALSANGAFAEPVLEVHTDLTDFLLLDPIHDVDTAVGWPQPAKPRSQPNRGALDIETHRAEKPDQT